MFEKYMANDDWNIKEVGRSEFLFLSSTCET